MEPKNLEDLINFLKPDLESKKDVYLQIETYLKRQSDRCISFEDLLVIIKEDLKEKKFVSEALSTWILYTNYTKHSPEELCEALHCNSGNLNEIIPIFCKLINENLLDIENILSKTNFTWNKKILDCIGNVSKKVVFRIYLDFINIGVVDTIFRTKSSAIRDALIDFVLLKTTFSIYHYTNAEQKHIITRFKNNYIKKIDDLRMQNNKDWYKLCMFTMKYCGKLLHSEIELTNIILHYLEVGFKTKTVEDRLLSYDCWKVLIDACNLDSNYISNPKQLRLLIKPLKIKLSKNGEVVLKRFETWFYLATILQEKILYCLEELLKFFFEIQDSGTTSEISIDTTIIKDTWLKRVELLISIIGHNEDDIHCLKIQHFNFAYPIVSSSNFPELDNVLLRSIYITCKMISKWDGSSKKRMKIQCLWGSTFKIIRNLNDNIKESVLRKVSEIFQLILQDCVTTNNNYFEDIMMPLFSLLSSFKEPICNPFVLNEIIIFPIIRCMLPQQVLDPTWSEEVVNLVRNTPKEGDKQSYFNRISELLKTSPHVNNSFVVLFWLYIIEELYEICKMPREDFSDFKEHALFLLTWIFTWNNLEEMQNLILPTWKRTFSEICSISNVFGEDLLQNCEKILKLQPQTGNNISTILPDISRILFHNKIYKKFGPGLLNVVCQCSQNPNIRKAKVLLFIPILKKILSFCTGGDTVEATSIILKVFECIEYILKPHQIYEILELLKEIAPKLNSNVKKKLPNSLKAILKDLAVSDNNLSSKNAVYILSQFDEEERKNNSQIFIRPVSSRSAKIASMAKNNAHSVLLKESISEVKRSREDNVMVTNLMLKRNAGNIDENSGDFVLIPKEIMIDKSKLSNRQKEMMNKRNGDIPALYQDLSRSEHSTLDTNSNSLSENNIDLTLNDNFKDIITDMKKKNDILHENFETDIQSIFTKSNSQFKNNSSVNLKDPASKVAAENIPSHENILPKVDLSMKFEDSLKEDKCTTKTVDEVNSHGFKQECSNNTNLSDSEPVKFEENTLTGAVVALPTLSKHDLHNLSLLPDKKLKRKLRNKPMRSRRMSDSHIVLKRYNFDSDRYDFQDDKKLVKENEELDAKEFDLFRKYLKQKPKDLKNKISDKDKSCLYKYNKVPLKQKYRSLENLNDISEKLDPKKVKKCFKIIQNNNDVSNSIKLRISITDENSYLEQDIIRQLDTEISKIDANLQSNSCLLNKNNSLVANSESIFESLDILNNSEQPNLGNHDKQSKTIIEDESLSRKSEKNITTTNSKIELNDASTTKEKSVISMNIMKNDEKEKGHLQKRKQRELDRIKMDIVGAEEFVITTPRKRLASKLMGFVKKQTSSGSGISTLTVIDKKTDKNQNSSRKNAEQVLNVIAENSNIQGLIDNLSNSIVTQKNSRKQPKPDSSNNQEGNNLKNTLILDCNDITLDQDKNKKVSSRTKRKSKSFRRTLGTRTHPRKRIQKNKVNISEIETQSLPTAVTFNSQMESNNTDANLPKSGTSTIHLQKDTVKNQNETENHYYHYNLVESAEQTIDFYSEDGINQNTDASDLQNEEVNFRTLGKVLNLKKLDASSEIVRCSLVNDDSNSNRAAKNKTDHNTSTVLSETDKITGNFEKKIYNYDDNGIYGINETKSVFSKEPNTKKNIQDVAPDVIASTSMNCTESLQKLQPYKTETFDEHETLTCNPYINIQEDEDVMDKFEKHGPGAVKMVIKDLDFDDLPLAFETPKKESIPCSPVCDDTPDKNKELVKNTLDISPIKLEFAESEICERNIASIENEKTYIKKPSSRSAKLLNLLSTPNDLTPSKFLQAPKKVIQSEMSSSSTQRIHKIISKCQMPIEHPDDTVRHDIVSIPRFISEDQNVLKFTRELPSPLATPNGSILKKRKFSDICDDNISSYSKRMKRVNFSDPPTTSQKIYFTENEEKSSDDMIDASSSFISELNVMKASSICPKLSTCTMDINDVVTLLNRDLVKHFHSVNIRTVGDLANLNDNQVSQLEFLGEPRLKRITEALDIISESYSSKEKDGFPICVDLVDCTHALDKLSAIDSNFKKFRSSNIRTIGDLAKLTKPEVLQLSLKFSSVVQALHKYNRRLNKRKLLTKQMQEELNEDADSAEQVEDNVLRDDSDASITYDLEKIPCETIPMTYKKVLRRSVDEELRYIKEQYNLNEIRNILTHLKDFAFAPK